MTLLASEALGLGHGYALQSNLLQRLLHLVELERFDDGFDLFQPISPLAQSRLGGEHGR